MKIFRDYNYLKEFITTNSVIAIGNFDGLHPGHQQVLNKAKEIAKKNSLPFIIITFEPHPNVVLKGKEVHKRVITLKNKIAKLQEFKPDFILLQRFNKKFASMTALNFIREVLVESLKAHTVIVGYDFLFGVNRKGNTEFLKTQSTFFGFHLETIPQVMNNGIACSSTILRQLLSSGQIEAANSVLGHNYSFSSKVKPGNQIGRTLDCRTANIPDINNIALKYGVYLGMASFDNITKAPVIINYGIRPTVTQESKEVLEVHFLNQDVDLYNKNINVELLNFVRPEKKFNSLDDLKTQIHKDLKIANDYFSEKHI